MYSWWFDTPRRGHLPPMEIVTPAAVQLQEAWIEGEADARWRSGTGHGPDTGAAASGSSVLEVASGCRLPRHTDSAEELIVVLSGDAEVTVGGESAAVTSSQAALVPPNVPHEVRNAGDGPLIFLAVYASTDVVTRYEAPVQPDGDQERRPVG